MLFKLLESVALKHAFTSCLFNLIPNKSESPNVQRLLLQICCHFTLESFHHNSVQLFYIVLPTRVQVDYNLTAKHI